jgi:hypothetical protein
MEITISSLPSDIQSEIPLSIRLVDTHQLEDLPNDIQYLILNYLEKSQLEYTYDIVYDAKPEISIYDDLHVVATKKELIGEYLKNYFLIPVTSYPWDATFGCRLKTYLSTKDTALRETLITNEVNNIVNAMASDYDIAITVVSISITPIQEGTIGYSDHTYYKIDVELQIDGEDIVITMSS